jgi:hypothetical protein
VIGEDPLNVDKLYTKMIASCHAAASMRDVRVHELARYIDWWQDLVIHDGPGARRDLVGLS